MAPSEEAAARPTSDTGTSPGGAGGAVVPGGAGGAVVPDADGWWREVIKFDVAAYAAIAAGITAITTPPRAPQANAFAERWVRTVRYELLDRTLFWNERQLKALLVEYIDHYNRHRPHRALDQRAPNDQGVVTSRSSRAIQRRATCGGLINEYRHAA